eukprot:snap_masked-scaffold_68-processed-gene-0.81-mRNA-1 protein AED:1.00 eAED:1.00 QI:0/0/0/0/1/1/2/0/75
MKIVLLIINQNADSFIDNQNQNDYQIIIDNSYQITPLAACDEIRKVWKIPLTSKKCIVKKCVAMVFQEYLEVKRN